LGSGGRVERIKPMACWAKPSPKLVVELKPPSGEPGEIPNRVRNGLVFTTAYPQKLAKDAARRATVATVDPHDRAHLSRSCFELLENGARVPSAVPRRYPPCQVNGAGLSVDSQFDDLYERQRRLDEELGGVAGVSFSAGGGATMAGKVHRALDGVDDSRRERAVRGDERVWWVPRAE
jgi:hypothetical protein